MPAALLRADTWPLEAALVWVATGNAALSANARDLAQRHRQSPGNKRLTLGMWFVVREELARGLEAVDGAIYRLEFQEGWTPGMCDAHPIKRAMEKTAGIMVGKPASGCFGGLARTAIPGKLWRSAVIVDDRQHGLILRLSTGEAWRDIDVPAAPFRALGAKRGRRPAGLSEGVHLPRTEMKTIERLRRNKDFADKRADRPVAPRKRGRPKKPHGP